MPEIIGEAPSFVVTPVKKISPFFWFIIFLAFIVVGGSAYYGYVVGQDDKIATGDIKDWNVSTGQLLTFKYPLNWMVNQELSTEGLVVINPTNNKGVGLTVSEKLYVKDIDTPEEIAKASAGNELVKNKKTIVVDGKTAVYQEVYLDNYARIEVYIGDVKKTINSLDEVGNPVIKTGTHLMTLDLSDLGLFEKYRDVFSQIISTVSYTTK